MKTSLEFDTLSDTFIPKPSQLQVVLLNANKEQVVIGEADFDLSKYSQTQQTNEQVLIEAKENPESFQLATGQDHIEIVVKTVNLGDQETPTTTVDHSAPTNNTRSSNRNSF